MRNKNPIKGLLVYSFYASGSAVIINLLVSLGVSIAFLVSGVGWVFQILVFLVAINLPMSTMIGMASKNGKWERYQLTMPITRGQLLGMQYITILITVAIATVILVSVIGGAVLLHEDLFYGSFINSLLGTAHSFGLPLLITSMVFPLANSKIGRDREATVLTICMAISIAINAALPQVGYRLGLAVEIIPSAFLITSAALFVLSFFVAKKQYSKLDF